MEENIVHLGTGYKHGSEASLALSAHDRRQHLYVIGKSGTGKTTLLRNLILQDLYAGRGVGVIDPHGDLAESILDIVPTSRTDDVMYFCPADADFPIGFNPFAGSVPSHLAASEIVGALKSIWRDSWGPRLEYILYAAVAALLECQNVSFLGLQRMLSDAQYRQWVVKQVKDPMVRSFWLHEFARYDEKYLREAVGPIQNKVGQLLMAAPLRNILGQVRSRIDARYMLDTERIFIANLSKGRLGADKSNLLGALLMAQFQLAAMSRADITEEERKQFLLYVDEFQNFSTDSFASALSEARKYGLSLTLSHQYMGQLSDGIQDAVLGNVGSLVAFRVGGTDAEVLAREFGSEYHPSHFTELGNHEVGTKFLSCAPVFGKTLPPLTTRAQRRETIIRRSRERFGTPREVVEDKITRWFPR